MIHTSISAYANRNGIRERLGALFPLLFTTFNNVLCSKFVSVWEMLWTFKVARWTCDRCMKINKSPTVSNGVGASSFEIWTANLAQSLTVGTLTNSRSFIFGVSNWKFCKVSYPVGTPKSDTEMQIFLTWDFLKLLMLLLLHEKNLIPLDIQGHCIHKLGKIQSEPKLLSGVYYWFLKLYTRIIWHSYFPSHRIS